MADRSQIAILDQAIAEASFRILALQQHLEMRKSWGLKAYPASTTLRKLLRNQADRIAQRADLLRKADEEDSS